MNFIELQPASVSFVPVPAGRGGATHARLAAHAHSAAPLRARLASLARHADAQEVTHINIIIQYLLPFSIYYEMTSIGRRKLCAAKYRRNCSEK